MWASSTLTDTGTINFLDVDWSQSHSTTVTPSGGNALGGTLTAAVTNSATGDGSGVVTWTYNVANSATQYLGAGETATETFTVTITDSAGLTDTQTITVTVTGTNDAPAITVDTSGGGDRGCDGPDAERLRHAEFHGCGRQRHCTRGYAYNGDANWSGGSADGGPGGRDYRRFQCRQR